MNTKVQKNTVSDNSKKRQCPNYILKRLSDPLLRRAVTDILKDYIVHSRICEGLTLILNVYDPNAGRYDMSNTGFTGFDSAIRILGVEEYGSYDSLYANLSTIACRLSDNNTYRVDLIASLIISEWEKEIKNYFSTKNQ